MIERFASRILLLLLGGSLVSPLYSAQSALASNAAPPAAAEDSAKLTTTIHPVKPGPLDGRITWVTAKLLEKLEYLQKPLDASLASKFFDHYLEDLDQQRLHFLQSDLAEFERYRTNLDKLTMTESLVSDSRPAFVVFNRFMERLQQRVEYVDHVLHTEKFSFNDDERILINRKDSPYPKDLAEAKQLWRERLRYEYLQEHLGKLAAKKKPETSVKADLKTTELHPSAPSGTDTTAKRTPEAKPKTEAEEIVETLSHRYHRTLRAYADFDNDDVLQYYLSALSRIYDPHSDYLGRAQFEQFSIGMNLSLFGIGAQLRADDGYCVLEHLLPGGPALKSKKLQEKDRIVAVAQSNQPPVDIVEMNLTKAVQLIRGPKGTEVRLTIIPAGADASSRKIVSLIRDEIPLEDSAAKARIIDLPDDKNGKLRLGVIDLPSFYAPFDPSNNRDKSGAKSSTTADVSILLKKLEQEKVQGVILDLRHNGGGSLEEAIRLTGLFIKEGPVVQVKDSFNNIQVDKDEDPSVLYEGPLVVLTSRFSASASEIVAGALQDYGRALLVGDSSTHGKGTVQSVNDLHPHVHGLAPSDNRAVKVTIKKFYRASGLSTQKIGVTPDIVLPSIWNVAKDIGESSLDTALDADRIPSAKYDPVNLVDPCLAELRKRSAERVATDPEFVYTREDMQQMKKAQADKTVSLNEKVRLQEKEENDAREKARKQERKERLAHHPSQEVDYELPLKLAVLPGLPPPTNLLAAAASPHGVVPAPLGTNTALASANTVPAAADAEGDEEKAPPMADITLQESEHILADYISVFPKHNVLTAAP
jgi:carboxyl-terminal processing protease